MTRDKRLWVISGLALSALITAIIIEPVKQDSGYHSFADTRSLLSIPNFFNVISNLPFLIIGALGIKESYSLPVTFTCERNPLGLIYKVFFAGVLLIGPGSGYYHLHPDNFSLLWDRIPMTISFSAFFCAVIGECISPKAARLFLPFLLTAGIASVVYWYQTEARGQGDLRAYLLVQFLPIVLTPVIYWLFDGKTKNCAYVWPVLGAYLLAKIAEIMDAPIYRLLNFSGHTLKHLLAASGAYFIYRALKRG